MVELANSESNRRLENSVAQTILVPLLALSVTLLLACHPFSGFPLRLINLIFRYTCYQESFLTTTESERVVIFSFAKSSKVLDFRSLR